MEANNPIRGPIPAQVEDNDLEDTISVFHFCQSMAEIEGIINKHGKGFLIPFTGSQLSLLQDFFKSQYQFRLSFSATSLIPIVDHVRNTILQWALRLEKEGVTGNGLSFSSDEVKKAHMSTHINIKNLCLNSKNVFQELVVCGFCVSTQIENYH